MSAIFIKINIKKNNVFISIVFLLFINNYDLYCSFSFYHHID